MLKKISRYVCRETDFIQFFLLSAFCAVGLYNEYLCCFAVVVLSVYLIYITIKNKVLFYYINLSSAAVTVIVVFYFLSVLWAVDSGEAFLGAVKYLPLFLVMLIVMQSEKSRESYFDILPYFAVFMTVSSAILSFISVTEDMVEIAGRLCGFFQYSNTFALFLLISFVVLITKHKLNVSDYLCVAVLLAGIIYSGSRTVFVLLIISVVTVLISLKNKKNVVYVILITFIVILIAVAIAYITDNFYSIGRFLTMSFKESTLLGRLLYYIDAVPQILKHPFGMGYSGYYFTQQSFQTGVYSVFNVHNDFLQIMLDIGWGPAILLICSIIKSFFSKNASFRKRLLLFVICSHSFFDFDLQYVSMFILLILLTDFDDSIRKEYRVNKKFSVGAFAVIGLVCFYLGISQTFSYIGKYEMSAMMYPFKTRDNIMLMLSETDITKTEKKAERIIECNEYVSVAYSAKGKIAFSYGDLFTMIENKEKALDLAVFDYEEYVDYCTMLIHAVKLYSQAGDDEGAGFCINKLVEIEKELNANTERLSYFGKMINDQPVTQLPEDIHMTIAEFVKSK